jgi:hypothetical protein
MCEAVTRNSKSWWTIDGGYCLPYSLAYRTLGLDTLSIEDNCTFFFKCALTNSLDPDCQCENATACREEVNSYCTNPYLEYPTSGVVVSPYIDMAYARDRDWKNKKPDIIGYNGRVKCIGYQLITTETWWSIDEKFEFHNYRFSERQFCYMKEGIEANRNYSGPRYDANCWNNSKTFNNRSYQISFLCQTRCISKYRVRDGITDCLPSEEFQINSCPQIQRHRLQCSSSELTCLLAGALGNWAPDCSNNRDEYDYESGILLRINLACEQRNEPVCVYLRNYIQTSSYKDANNTSIASDSIFNDHTTTIIPFRSYCNSFFNLDSGMDESPEFCKEWICLNDEYQCLSGQCILQSWVCDGKRSLLGISLVVCIFFSWSLQVNGIVVMDQMNKVFLL